MEFNEQFNIYIGANNDTNDLETDLIVKTIKKSINAFSFYEINGVYTFDNGKTIVEKSLKVEILGQKRDLILKLVKNLKKLLKQESIMVQTIKLNTEFI